MEQHIHETKIIYGKILEYLESDNDTQIYFEDLKAILSQQQIVEDKYKFREILNLISRISANHHRSHDLIPKIEQFLRFLKNDIKNQFSNLEIFKIFIQNKRILLCLFQEKIINPDYSIFQIITNIKFSNYNKYPEYFYLEFKAFFDEKSAKNILSELEINEEEFEKKRQVGENDHYICELIRNDSIIDFVKYVNQTNLPLSTTIKKSIFETNRFLIKRNPSLIEYAAFFGSIQIFQYLKLNQVKLEIQIWMYAIHGLNAEIIHIIERNVAISQDGYEFGLIESIKCHHNDIKNYIQSNLIDSNHLEKISKTIARNCIKYSNFSDFPNKFDGINYFDIFYNMCKYDYPKFVYFFLFGNSNIDININEKIVEIFDINS